jgi:predicted nucleic acid-binding Zn ribbon protein
VAGKHRPFDFCATCGVPIRKGSTFCSFGCARITWSRPNSSQPEEVTLPAA